MVESVVSQKRFSGNVQTSIVERVETDLGTSPRVVRLIPRRAGSISSLYGAKTYSKAKNISVCNLDENVRRKKRPQQHEV